MPPEQRTRRSGERVRRLAVAVAATSIAICLPVTIAAQGMTGTLIATVKDEQGSPVQGARVRIHSPALIGGPVTLTTPASGRLRFLTLPPGEYGLDVDLAQFDSYHEADIAVGAGGTIERTVVLVIGGVAESIVVEGAGTRIDARDPGNSRMSATVAFGAGLNTAQPGNPQNHHVLPRVIEIKAGGVVNFAVAGFHQITVYLPGTTPESILVPPSGVFVDDAVNRYYQGILPAGGPLGTPATINPSNASNRVESISFPDPGLYLVVCNVRTHFLDGMYAYVRVSQ